MAKILDGIIVRNHIRERLKEKIQSLSVLSGFTTPKLVIIQVGTLHESTVFIRQKKLFGEAIGAQVELRQFDEHIHEDALIQEIQSCNTDKTIHGIIVQMPLPASLDPHRIIESLDPIKDVDGLHSANIKLLWEKKTNGHIPATARGIISLLDFYNIPIEGKHTVVIGRSALVGKPTALAFLNRNSTVTICHSKTTNITEETRRADILVTATGKDLITSKHVSPHQTVIDVGIRPIVKKDGSPGIAGDVEFDQVKDIVSALSPVPGGVGPMTVASLFENLMDAYYRALNRDIAS